MMKDENVEAKIAASQKQIEMNANAATTQGKADLLAHLRKLINRSDSSDLEFVCKDGVKVKACRIFLAGRSIFDSIFTYSMFKSTSESSIISLPEISAPAFLAILEFLYTGSIVDYGPKDWQTGLEIISIGNLFLLLDVVKIVEKIVLAQIPNVDGDLQQAATMLTVALTFKYIPHDSNAVLLQLVSLLESSWMHLDNARHLSEEAVDFILRHTKSTLKAEDRLEFEKSLEEYFRFRGVLLWCMYSTRSSCIEKVGKLVDMAIPLANKNLYGKGFRNQVVWLPDYCGDSALDEGLQLLYTDGAIERAMRLLEHIDWRRLPPTIFVRIVEPLKLVSLSRLLDIFRFHSLQRVTWMPLKLSWAHNKSYAVHDDGLVIEKTGSSPGSAICQLENRFDFGDDLCKWRFSIHEVCSYCLLGFICGEEVDDPCRTWNLEGNFIKTPKDSATTTVRMVHWQVDAGTVLFVGGVHDCRIPEPYFETSVQTIEFQYCRNTQSCAVAVNDKQLGTVWTDLPSSSVFPALSLADNCEAWVSLELISGFQSFGLCKSTSLLK